MLFQNDYLLDVNTVVPVLKLVLKVYLLARSAANSLNFIFILKFLCNCKSLLAIK